MSENVVSLADERISRRAHMVGEAVCLACRAAWDAVAPVGTRELECPECHLPRGVWHRLIAPEEGERVWTCNGCEGDLFYMLEGDWLMCATCGLGSRWESAV